MEALFGWLATKIDEPIVDLNFCLCFSVSVSLPKDFDQFFEISINFQLIDIFISDFLPSFADFRLEIDQLILIMLMRCFQAMPPVYCTDLQNVKDDPSGG
jgi:hypothetical protein